MKDDDYHNEIRQLIKGEIEIVNNSMIWMILLQGLLFAGYYNIFSEDIAFAF